MGKEIHEPKVKKKVLIVGAGIAGLATYLGLDKNKFDVEIIEKASQIQNVGYSMFFLPPGKKALKKLGFEEREINKLGWKFKRKIIKDTQGKITKITNWKKLIRKYEDPMHITRNRLQNLLKSKVPKEDITFNENIKNIGNSSEKTKVEFSNKKQKQKYDLVVGADGINSRVRESKFSKYKLNKPKYHFAWCWIYGDPKKYPKESQYLGGLNKGICFFNSGEKKKCCIVLAAHDHEIKKSKKKNPKEKLIETIEKIESDEAKNVLKNIPKMEEIHYHKDCELKVNSWIQNRIVLIGDAAHATSTFLGAGGSLALEDAFTISHFLNKEENVNEAAKRYFEKQKPRIDMLSQKTLEKLSKKDLKNKNEDLTLEHLDKIFCTSLLYE